jgi:hemerythrin superfamily protein
MDAITLLKNDHKTVEQLFKRFEKAGDQAHTEKRQVVDRIIEELSRHAAVEEQLFYPVARATVPDTEDIALESIEEHHIVKWVLSELEHLDPSDERFDAKVTVLIENVRHHVEEEETEFFPKVRDELGRNALADLGEAIANAKKTAPTHPHPHSPDSPPGNLVSGAVAGVVDRVTDTVSGIAQGTVTAAGELIDRIRHTNQPKPAPIGSTTTRTTATKVRRTASAATDGVERTARSASRGAKSTVKAGRAGAKATATSARRSATATKSTAKRDATTTKRTGSAAAASTRRTAKNATTATKRAAGSR